MHTWIKSTRNIAASIEYPVKEKRYQNDVRVAGVACGGGIIDTGDKKTITDQFLRILDLGGRRRRKHYDDKYPLQGYKRTLSFSRNEISPEDPEWVEKALAVTKDVMDNLVPDTQWIAVAQKDGKAGLVHVHVVNSALHATTLKALAGRETSYQIFRDQTESIMRKHGIIPDAGKNHSKRERSAAVKRQNHAKDEEEYSWMQDLEHRIRQAAACASAAGEFENKLKMQGVIVTRKTKSGWTFALANSQKKEYVGKKARYDRFSEDFSAPTLNRLFDENYRRKSKTCQNAPNDCEIKRNEKNGELHSGTAFVAPESYFGHKTGGFDNKNSRELPDVPEELYDEGFEK